MKVRIIKRDGYGDRYGRMHKFGDVVEFSDQIAVKLLTNRIAEPVRDKEKERAVKKPRERTGAVTTRSFSGKDEE